jgi:integrase/recombinase XerD
MPSKQAQIQRFSDWLIGRGRTEGTAELYAHNVAHCLADRRGLTGRLVRDGLAPKTKRTNLAALRAWAKYTKDTSLLETLDDLKLPPPERIHEKRPLTLDEWDGVIAAVDELPFKEAEAAALMMICMRGFRVGDVCRLTKRAVREGVRTGLLNYRGKSGRQIEWTVAPFREHLDWFAAQKGWRHAYDLIMPRSAERLRYKAARLRLYRLFGRLAEAAGIPPSELTPHRLRRTYAVHFLDGVGGDLEKLRQHMGWASIATAAQYVDHSRREELDAVAEQVARRRGR